MKKYRPNVGLVVFNKDKKILVCRRKENFSLHDWQFPQGGIEAGEDVVTAGLRELQEETSITSVRVVAQMKRRLRYDFPSDFIKKNKSGFIGQEQTWLLLYFYGQDDEINVKTKNYEFSKYKWSDFQFAINRVWIVKKMVYQKVRDSFEKLIADFKL